MFFIQAEDGIRDRDVTGVQTCALPISTMPCSIRSNADLRAGSAFDRIEQGIVVVVERPAHAGSSDHACNRARSRPERRRFAQSTSDSWRHGARWPSLSRAGPAELRADSAWGWPESVANQCVPEF